MLQPFDTNKLKLDALLPAMLEGSTSVWTWDGKLFHVPHCWGSEAISWRTDLTKLDYATLSYGTMWEDQYRGKVQGRPHSILLGIGLWMDKTGKLPSNRMMDTFKDEASMKKVYDEVLKFAITKKPWIKQFWDSADNTKSGLMENGVVIGQTWDGPALSLKKDGKPVSYMAPQEGAIAVARRLVARQGRQERRAGLRMAQLRPLGGHLGQGRRRLGLQPDRKGLRHAAFGRREEELHRSLPERRGVQALAPSAGAVVVRRTAYPVRREAQGRLITAMTPAGRVPGRRSLFPTTQDQAFSA